MRAFACVQRLRFGITAAPLGAEMISDGFGTYEGDVDLRTGSSTCWPT